MDSRTAVSKLLEVDPQFVELCKALFGDGLDPEAVWAYMYTPNGAASVPVVKMNPAPSDIATKGRQLLKTGKRIAGPLASGTTAGVIANQLPQRGSKVKKSSPDKSDKDSFEISVEFAKTENDKHQVFGWASVVKMNGQPVIDRQGDWIDPEEIEKAAYAYVEKSRKGGHQHKRDGDAPFHASNMIESIVFTDEKVEKMGLPDDFPRGWWVGYKVHDEDTWAKVKSGEVTGFSIHGRGKRVEVKS